jgi:hypothetical protein
VAVAALYALAMVWLGFAHQPFAPVTAPSSLERLAYVLPDGTLPDLCIPQSDGPVRDGHFAACDACLVAGGHAAPTTPPTLADPEARAIARVEIAPSTAPNAAARERARARGPPIG